MKVLAVFQSVAESAPKVYEAGVTVIPVTSARSARTVTSAVGRLSRVTV